MFCLCLKSSSQSMVCQVLEWAWDLTYYFASLATLWRNLFGCIRSYFTFLKLCVFLYNMLESFMHQLLFTERWFAYYLFHISISGFMRGVCSALKLQFQKASNSSQENWNRKLKYYRVLGYDSRLHGRNTPEYLRAQNVIYESIVTVMQLEALLLNWESPLGMLNWINNYQCTIQLTLFKSIC